MDVGRILLDILIVLVAAKLAAEGSERVGVPPVVGEILAGIVIGPSVLGLVGDGDEVLRTLGELGVILLLLEVGMEMDLRELSAVGKASLSTATIGVVTPLVLGFGAMELIGDDPKTSLFVGAALTATSVGITARVFGDLKALATTEARIVLGAAVADDVMGLVVLTVVVRLVTGGSLSVLGVAWIVVVAVGFLVVGGAVGLRVAPAIFAYVERFSRSSGTMVALALAFTLAFAELADAAKLAPIVGAFVAGLALGQADQSERISAELRPVGHLLIPIFFLQIGIDADVGAFFSLGVLRDAALLLAVAIIGKLVSAAGAAGTPADKGLIGLGMLPRGEVGLIFATIGLANGILGDDLYAALLLVVLVTTLMTPPLLKFRYTQIRKGAAAPVSLPVEGAPPGGYVQVRGDGLAAEVVLAARPPGALGLSLALEAALRVAHARPSPGLVEWLAALGDDELRWHPRRAAPAFFAVLRDGNARSWRFLHTTGVLERVLPELAAALRSRQADPFEVDPAATHHLSLVERLRHPVAPAGPADLAELHHPEWLLLAGLLVEAMGGRTDEVSVTRRIMRRLDLGAAAEEEVTMLVADRDLLGSTARRLDAFEEATVLRLAGHLDTPERARALYLLSMGLEVDEARWRRQRVAELHRLAQEALAHPELTGLEARNLLQRQRTDAARLAAVPAAVERIEGASREFVLANDPATVARQAALVVTLTRRAPLAVQVVEAPAAARAGAPGADGSTSTATVLVAAIDRPDLLGATSRALGQAAAAVQRATAATWTDGRSVVAVQLGGPAPAADDLRRALAPPSTGPRRGVGGDDPGDGRAGGDVEPPIAVLPSATMTFDEGASPWHTVAHVDWPLEEGTLASLADAVLSGGAVLHGAVVKVDAVDGTGPRCTAVLDLTDAEGRSLDDAAQSAVVAAVRRGTPADGARPRASRRPGRSRRWAPWRHRPAAPAPAELS
jgi:Kef-type K+ transport system membrane component KefB